MLQKKYIPIGDYYELSKRERFKRFHRNVKKLDQFILSEICREIDEIKASLPKRFQKTFLFFKPDGSPVQVNGKNEAYLRRRTDDEVYSVVVEVNIGETTIDGRKNIKTEFVREIRETVELWEKLADTLEAKWQGGEA